jgi:hypothetical protein
MENVQRMRYTIIDIIFNIPPLSWLHGAWIDFSIWCEWKYMKKMGYENYIGERFDKRGKLIASGVVCWRKKPNVL